MTEAQLLRTVRDLAAYLHLSCYHTHDSRRSEPGFPDLVIAGPSGVLFRELKTEIGKVTQHQRAWIEQLTKSGADAGVWRPRDLPRIADELKALAA